MSTPQPVVSSPFGAMALLRCLLLALVALAAAAEEAAAASSCSGEASIGGDGAGGEGCGCGSGALSREAGGGSGREGARPGGSADGSNAAASSHSSEGAADAAEADADATAAAEAEADAAPTVEPARLVWIPGGVFTMGHDNRSLSPSTFDPDGEGPSRRVSVSGLWVGETEVSNREWAAFAAATGYESESERFGWSSRLGAAGRRVGVSSRRTL